MAKNDNTYSRIIEEIFRSKYKKGDNEVQFEREDIRATATELGVSVPKNLGDVVYSFRYRSRMPDLLRKKAGKGNEWIIRSAGKAKYKFVLTTAQSFRPQANLSITKIPDSTPGIISKYSLSDEQALLAKIRYNRIIDIFLGIACYSLQNHLRTSVPELGQIETDEIYVGLDQRGVHYVVPVQAKGGADKLSVVQIEQDFAMCEHKFPELVCRPVGTQFMPDDTIVVFEFELSSEAPSISAERHYKLVNPDELTDEELRTYKARLG